MKSTDLTASETVNRTDLWVCPKCRGKHALCWLVGKSTKRLGVNCDDSGKLGQTEFVPIAKSVVDCILDEDLLGIPEYFTSGARKAIESNATLALGLTDAPADAERGMPNAGHDYSEDDAKIATLKAEMESEIAAREAIDAQIRELNTQRKIHDDAAKAKSAKIGELKTFKLL